MMKKLLVFPIAAALALAVSCEKPMSEAERNAQVEREVQQRLAAERTAAEQERLAQQQAELDAREQALADKEAAAAKGSTTAAATPRATARPQATASSGSGSRVASSDRGGSRSYDTFYRKLQPHGAWRETADYGYVWQPRQAQQSRNWRPYTEGRWAYTDAGWTWISEEPFGWATYHYGRWTRLRGVGWVWVPGEEWAPAWVSWRASDQHVGWAPLPPEARFERRTGIKKWADSYYDIDVDEYVFIPNEEIGSNNISRAVVPVERNVTIVNQTTNVTNITYTNTTIVNEGPDYERLRGRSREPLRRLRIERQYEMDEEESPRASVTGEVIAMMTPLFSARAVQRPQTVGAPIQQGAVERASTTSGNQPEVERARAKMRAEATPPPDAPPKRFEKPVVAEGTPAPAPAATAATAATATASPQASATPAAPTAIATATASASATPTPRATATAAASIAPSPNATATATAAATPLATATPSPTLTPRPTVAATATPTATATATATATPTATPTPRALATATPTATATATPTPTPRPTATATATPVGIATATPSATPAATIAASPSPAPGTRRVMPPATPAPAITPADEDEDAAPQDPPTTSAGLTGQDARQQRGVDRAEQMRKRAESPAVAAAPVRSPGSMPVPAFTPRPGLSSREASPAPAVTPEDVLDAPREATPFPKKLQPQAASIPAATAAPTMPARAVPPQPVAAPPAAAANEAAAAAAEPTPVVRRTTSRLSDVDADAAASPTPTPTPTPSPAADARGKKAKRSADPSEDTDTAETPEAKPAGTDVP